jgi:hypothetical protein
MQIEKLPPVKATLQSVPNVLTTDTRVQLKSRAYEKKSVFWARETGPIFWLIGLTTETSLASARI